MYIKNVLEAGTEVCVLVVGSLPPLADVTKNWHVKAAMSDGTWKEQVVIVVAVVVVVILPIAVVVAVAVLLMKNKNKNEKG